MNTSTDPQEVEDVADEPTRSVGSPLGGPLDVAGGAPPALPSASEGDRYIKEVLDPLSLSVYEGLLVDPDAKVRRQAAADVQELVGRKGKVGPNVGGITLNLAPEKMKSLVGGLAKVLVGRKEDVIDV
jgi:hypothetical protein